MRSMTRAAATLRLTALAVAAAMMVTLTGCGKDEDETTSSGWERIDDGDTADTEAEESATADTEAEERAAGSDFAETTSENTTQVQIGRLILDVPEYYVVEQESDEYYMCAYEANSEACALIILTTMDADGLTEAEFAGKKDALAASMAGSMVSSEDASVTLVNSKDAEYLGMPGYSYDYTVTIEGIPGTMDVDAFLNTDDDLVYASVYIEVGEYDRDTATDYGNMMRNAQWAESLAETETSRGSDFATSTEDSSQDASNGSSTSSSSNSSSGSGVDPTVKEALDSYESMMNSYCDFMERYQNASQTDALAMLGDYTSMLTQYTDAMSALSEIDEGSLGGDDLAYYLEVTGRVTKRLLEVGQ